MREVVDDLVIDYNFNAGPYVGLSSKTKYNCRVEFWKDNKKALRKAQLKYGVSPEYIIAIIGIESK